ncbi:MAG: exopolysaccharide biosynthesis polyprenyl glycosylphosphotransferase [Clostridia bacterium]|nr:exopolysaccharide biosynthesis polyprenyl glycosylphosphotransferase [Clostridia bacterium]
MYQKKNQGWSQHLDFMALDIAALEISLLLSFLTHVGFSNMIARRMFWGSCIFLPFLDLAIMVTSNTYHNVIRRSNYQELSQLLNQTTYLALIFGGFLIMNEADLAGSSYVFFQTILSYIVLGFISRTVWKRHLQHRLHIRNHTGLLVVAKSSRLHEVVEELVNHNYNIYRIVGAALLDENVMLREEDKFLKHIMMGDKEISDLPVVATRNDLIPYLVTNWVDEIYLDAMGEVPIDLIDQIISMGITVHLSLNNLDRIVARHKDIEWICGQAALTVSLGYISGRDLFLKRLMDVTFGFVGCLVTGLLTLVLGPLIYIASPGPIFFHQTRIGENGRKFEMYKFRSMYMDAEKRKQELAKATGQENELMFKMEHDPRIIGMRQDKNGKWKKGIGGWIRDLSLDEFPQFFNVLKGDMSLVGTRPPTVDEWEHYKPSYRARMSTRPGLTGLWQVSGRSKIRDFDQVVQLDREYIEDWSLKLDWQILAKTVVTVITRKGAM